LARAQLIGARWHSVGTVTSVDRLALVLGLLSILPGCDQIKSAVGLDGGDEEAKADDAKSDDTKVAAAETKTDDAKTADAKTEDAPADDAKAEADPSPADDAKAEADPPAAEPVPAEEPEAAAPTEAAADLPCIIGTWDATDYSAAVERAIRKDPTLASLKRSGSGGDVQYVLAEPTDGEGDITAVADGLTYSFSGKVQGVGVSLKVVIDGETKAKYKLVGTDGIEIDKPTSNTMKVKANINIKGLGSKRASDKVDLDFDGDFVFDCTEDSLEVWREARSKWRPMKFERAKPE